MHLREILLGSALLLLAITACSKPTSISGEEGGAPGLLAGTWEATVFELTFSSATSSVRDLVQEGSGILLRVEEDGAYHLILSRPDGTEREEQGRVSRDAQVLRFRAVTGEAWDATHTVNEIQAVLDAHIQSADVDGDGEPDDGHLRVVLERLQVGDLSDLVGIWSAASFTFQDLEDFDIYEDIIPQGAFFTIRIRPEGQYAAVSVSPGQPPTYRIGSIQRYGTVLIMSGLRNDNENDIEVHLIDGQMELTHCDDLWDFDRDGEDDEGTLTLLLDPVDPIPLTDLAGSWEATRYEYIALEHPERFTDLVSAGYDISIEIGADRSFRETVTPPGGGASTSTASASVLGQVLIVTHSDQGGGRYLIIERGAGVLNLRTAAAEWDFLGGGTPEAAQLYIRLIPSPESAGN